MSLFCSKHSSLSSLVCLKSELQLPVSEIQPHQTPIPALICVEILGTAAIILKNIPETVLHLQTCKKGLFGCTNQKVLLHLHPPRTGHQNTAKGPLPFHQPVLYVLQSQWSPPLSLLLLFQGPVEEGTTRSCVTQSRSLVFLSFTFQSHASAFLLELPTLGSQGLTVAMRPLLFFL